MLRPDSDQYKLYDYQDYDQQKPLLQEQEEVDDSKLPPDDVKKKSAGVPKNSVEVPKNSVEVPKNSVEVQKVVLEQSPNFEVAWLLGLLAVLVSCVLSAFSGVYFERVVKKSRQTSLIVRNIQLAMFSIGFGAISLFNDRKEIVSGGFFQGYNWATWAVILLQVRGYILFFITSYFKIFDRV